MRGWRDYAGILLRRWAKRRPKLSFMRTFDEFRNADALALLLENPSAENPLDGSLFAGKRIVCLVEAAADTTIVRKYFHLAQRVDFLLERDHRTIAKFVAAAQSRRTPHVTARHWESMLPTGGDAERACAAQNLALQHALGSLFDQIFDADSRLRPYRRYSDIFAAYGEAPVYQACMFLSKCLEILVEEARPDLVIALCASGKFWPTYIPILRETRPDLPVFVARSGRADDRMVALVRQLGRIWRLTRRDEGAAPATTVDTAASSAERCRAFADAADPFATWVALAETATAYKLYSEGQPLRLRRPYCAFNTVEAAFVSYNYRFRVELLRRLACSFDIATLSYDVSATAHEVLRRELTAATADATQALVDLTYFATGGPLGSLLQDFLDATRAHWLPMLTAVGMSRAQLVVFELRALDILCGYVASAIEYIAFTENIFRLYPPRLALAITGEVPWGRLLLRVAQRFGVPTFDMQIVAIWDEPRCEAVLSPKADHFFAMDEPSARLLARWGWPADRLYLNGIPRFDEVHAGDREALRKSGRRRLNLDDTRKVILFVSQALSVEYALAAAVAVAAITRDHPGYFVLVKLHPREPASDDDLFARRLGEVAAAGSFAVRRDVDIGEAICAADVVVGLYSLALIEAACFGRPVIAVNLLGKRYPEPMNLGDLDLAESATSTDELQAKLAALLDDPAYRAECQSRQRRYFARHPYMVDGGVLDRIVGVIQDVMDERPPRVVSLAQWDQSRGGIAEDAASTEPAGSPLPTNAGPDATRGE